MSFKDYKKPKIIALKSCSFGLIFSLASTSSGNEKKAAKTPKSLDSKKKKYFFK
jgi:hypothetical protein